MRKGDQGGKFRRGNLYSAELYPIAMLYAGTELLLNSVRFLTQ